VIADPAVTNEKGHRLGIKIPKSENIVTRLRPALILAEMERFRVGGICRLLSNRRLPGPPKSLSR